MGWLSDLLNKPYDSHHKVEIEKLLNELVQIGVREDFLSERPGGGFNMQCRNVRARQIGVRFNEIGGLEMMEYAQRYVRRKSGKPGKSLAEHLEYAWAEIGNWMR